MARLTLSFKGRVLRLIPLDRGAVIGSDPACDIHIDSLALQPRHAALERGGKGWQLRDLNTPDGTFVNGERIDERALQDEDVIRVGKHELLFSTHPDDLLEEPLPPTSLPESGSKKAWLQIMTGNNVGKTISLNRQMTNLGKPGLQTALIVRRNDGFFLSHLEGDRSPLVDGVPIGDRSHELRDGEIIQMGKIKMQFYLES